MIAFNWSGFIPGRSSICAWGSSVRKSATPSFAMRSVISILIVSTFSSCATDIFHCSSLLIYFAFALSLKSKLGQSLFHRVHCLGQISLLEKAEVTHAEYLAVQVFLSSAQHNPILFAQLFQHRFCIDVFRSLAHVVTDMLMP